MAMRLMGEQFVTGETIAEALANSRKFEARGFRYSYDMLGEAATTEEDAQRYYASYEQAIHAIGKAAGGRGIYEGPGISIKLSALHPRYSRSQQERTMSELLPRVRSLALLARRYDIGLNIDAEEADRLEISLDLLEALCFDPRTGRLERHRLRGAGLSEALPVRDRLLDRSGAPQPSSHHGPPGEGRLLGHAKSSARKSTASKAIRSTRARSTPTCPTSPARRSCSARRMPSIRNSPRTTRTRCRRSITSRARTTTPASTNSSACTAWANRCTRKSSARDKLNRPCRVYAPVGTHETLLAYLVRRLLENGANTSFVNRIADETVRDQGTGGRSGRRSLEDRAARRAAREDSAAAQSVRRRAPQFDGHRSVERTSSGVAVVGVAGERASSVARRADARRQRRSP